MLAEREDRGRIGGGVGCSGRQPAHAQMLPLAARGKREHMRRWRGRHKSPRD